jgi:hypothetical protein
MTFQIIHPVSRLRVPLFFMCEVRSQREVPRTWLEPSLGVTEVIIITTGLHQLYTYQHPVRGQDTTTTHTANNCGDQRDIGGDYRHTTVAELSVGSLQAVNWNGMIFYDEGLHKLNGLITQLF